MQPSPKRHSLAPVFLAGGLAIASLIPSTVFGAQVNVPADHLTIQEAIDAAIAGDTVLVAPGLYHESINIFGKDIVVRTDAGPQVTIIDPLLTNAAVRIVGPIGRSARLEGFTIRNGVAGVVITGGAAITVVNNHIVSNTGCGAGVSVEYSTPLIVSNLISGNFGTGCSPAAGGGVVVLSAHAVEIVGNVITNNLNGGISVNAVGPNTGIRPLVQGNQIGWNVNGNGLSFVNGFSGIVVNNLILENGGSGIVGTVPANSVNPIIINNTIVSNRTSGIGLSGIFGSTLIANNNVVAYSNRASMAAGGGSTTNQPLMWNNNFYSLGNAYEGIGPSPTGVRGNISVDPLFEDAKNSDYALKTDSPLINSGDNRHLSPTILTDLSNNIRVRGNTVDIGAFEMQSPTSDISYHWLQTYGFPRDGTSDHADPDGDGMDNWAEWRSDTIPTNALSLLRIVEIRPGIRRATVTWISGANRSYVLERSTGLTNQFSTLRTNLIGAAGTTSFLDGPLSSGPGQYFYRVSSP